MPDPTFSGLERLLGARLEAHDVSAYAQGVSTPAALREATVALSAVEDSSALSHLLYQVRTVDKPVQLGGGDADRTVVVEPLVEVVVVYKLRKRDQVGDTRRAQDLAQELLVALLAEATPAELSTFGGRFALSLENAGTVQITTDGAYLATTITIRAILALQTRPST